MRTIHFLKFVGLTILVAFWGCTAHAQTESQQVGTLRITFQDFQYLTDPEADAGHDPRTYGGLGPLTTYMVSVIPAPALNRGAVNEMKAGRLNDYADESIFINYPEHRLWVVNPTSCYASNLDTAVVNLFGRGDELTFLIPNQNRPAYVDIPLPDGNYYICYRVLFLHAFRPMGRWVFPNYNGLETDGSELEWGPPLIKISSGSTAYIQFAPSYRCMMDSMDVQYDYDNFLNCDVFRLFEKYLIRIGDLPLR